MNTKKSFKMLGASIATAAVIALVATPIAAFAAAPAAPTNSTNPVYLSSSTTTPVLLAANATPKLNASVYASKSSTASDRSWPLPSGAVAEYEFLSARGGEFDRETWKIYGDAHTTVPNNINLKVSSFTTNNGANSFDQVGQNGGDFSLGFAFVNAAGAVIESNFVYVTITGDATNPVNATYEFSSPVNTSVAPVVTTNPQNVSKLNGETATFTAAATGTPAPTVKWQSAPAATSTWTDIAGATSTTLTVPNVQAATDNGKQYRAVFTNSAGSVNSSTAVLSVSFGTPTEPTGSVAGGSQGTVNVPAGATSFSFTFTGVTAGTTYNVWAWSTPTGQGTVTIPATGPTTVNFTGLDPGTHTVALVDPATNNVAAWVTIVIEAPTNTSIVDLSVNVTTSNKFALEGVTTALDLGSTTRGNSTAGTVLPAFTVTDDRNALPGWNLTSSVNDFVNDGVAFPTNGGAVIPKSALNIEPRKVGAAVTGISAKPAFTAGTSNLFAEGLADSTTAAGGTQFDAKLTFTAPATAKAGKYTSKLTLTLTSK